MIKHCTCTLTCAIVQSLTLTLSFGSDEQEAPELLLSMEPPPPRPRVLFMVGRSDKNVCDHGCWYVFCTVHDACVCATKVIR